MNCWSVFKTFILCQLSDNRSLQGYSYLTFPSLVGPPHSELHYSSSYVVRHTVEMWVHHIWDFPFRWVCHVPHSVAIAFRATRILSTVGVDIPADRSFQSYQNLNNFKS